MRKKPTLPDIDEALTTRQLVEFHRTKDRSSADAQRNLPAENDVDEPPAIKEPRENIDDRVGTRHRKWSDRVHVLEEASNATSAASPVVAIIRRLRESVFTMSR